MSILDQISGVITGKFEQAKIFMSLVSLETKLAGLSVYPLLITLCFLLVILMSTWLCVMALILTLLVYFSHDVIVSLVGVLALNIGLLFLLLKYLTYNLKKMSFEKTRACFYNQEGLEYDECEKTND